MRVVVLFIFFFLYIPDFNGWIGFCAIARHAQLIVYLPLCVCVSFVWLFEKSFLLAILCALL